MSDPKESDAAFLKRTDPDTGELRPMGMLTEDYMRLHALARIGAERGKVTDEMVGQGIKAFGEHADLPRYPYSAPLTPLLFSTTSTPPLRASMNWKPTTPACAA